MYPNQTKAVMSVGSNLHEVQRAVRIFTVKNGAQQITKIMKTTPRTFDAFCSVLTELSLLTLAEVEDGSPED